MFPYRCESLLEKEFAEILFVSKEHFVLSHSTEEERGRDKETRLRHLIPPLLLCVKNHFSWTRVT